MTMVMHTINDFLTQGLPALRIAVIGDIMVDRYVFGDVSRISPEAPVPVNRVKHIKEVLGGAANVANNLATLDCEVHLAGVAGADAHGELLHQLLTDAGIHSDGVQVRKERRTTTKMRILGDRQQMMRLDFEEVSPLVQDEEKVLIEWLTKRCEAGLDGLVISDYGKGVCTPTALAQIISVAKAYQVPIIVDPKGSSWTKYDGVDYITPNVKELSECVGRTVANTDEAVVEAAKEVLGQLSLAYLVVTRSAQGITVVSREGNVWHGQATKQDVFDVSGAGDTVVAMFITALGAHLTMRAAIHISNIAAGIVVSKVGTYPIHRHELLQAWDALYQSKQTKDVLRDREGLASQIRLWQDAGDVVVFTNGCFDILHKGHVSYLEEAAALGDRLVIGLNTDASVQRLKGPSRPIVSEEDRAFVLQALRCVDAVILFDEDTPAELLQVLKPNVLVKGGDYTVETVIGKESVDRVQILTFQPGYSTTSIIERIQGLDKED